MVDADHDSNNYGFALTLNGEERIQKLAD